MKTFTINNRTYIAKEIDYNMICDFEDSGVSLGSIGDKSMSLIRAYIAACMGVSADAAGTEIGKFIMDGGDLSALTTVLADAMSESGFFRALSKTEEKNDTPSEEKKTRTKTQK